MTDTLHEYAIAKLEESHSDVVYHDDFIPEGAYSWIAVCDCDNEEVGQTNPYVRRQAPIAICDKTFVVANGKRYRYYLTGKCNTCERLHVVLRGEVND